MAGLSPAFLANLRTYDARQLSNAVYAMGKLDYKPGGGDAGLVAECAGHVYREGQEAVGGVWALCSCLL